MSFSAFITGLGAVDMCCNKEQKFYLYLEYLLCQMYIASGYSFTEITDILEEDGWRQ